MTPHVRATADCGRREDNTWSICRPWQQEQQEQQEAHHHEPRQKAHDEAHDRPYHWSLFASVKQYGVF